MSACATEFMGQFCMNCGATELAGTRLRPMGNSKGIVLSAEFVSMTVHTTIEYVMPSLSTDLTATEERCFPGSPCLETVSRRS